MTIREKAKQTRARIALLEKQLIKIILACPHKRARWNRKSDRRKCLDCGTTVEVGLVESYKD